MSASASSLPDRVLLTGASRGIGRAIALALMQRGVRLALVGRDRVALEGLRAGRREHAVVVADLAQPEQAEACVASAAKEFGGLDGFIASAGVIEYTPIGAISAGALAEQLNVNLIAPFLMAQRAADYIADAGGGAILFVASTLGTGASAPSTAAYAASKGGVAAMTRAFALELAPRGVRVNAIAPGVIDTNMVRVPRTPVADGAARDAAVSRELEALRALHPLGRLGTPADVAETALYLLAARYVTGTVVLVDGGLTLGVGAP
jgi:NAD(P)-dependent dehydrogenase (short-subunit alcohol dehydrogenase family)